MFNGKSTQVRISVSADSKEDSDPNFLAIFGAQLTHSEHMELFHEVILYAKRYVKDKFGHNIEGEPPVELEHGVFILTL
jgi:hypothetical protein